MKLSSEGFFTKWDQIITDLVTLTEETLTEKFRFLRSVQCTKRQVLLTFPMFKLRNFIEKETLTQVCFCEFGKIT